MATQWGSENKSYNVFSTQNNVGDRNREASMIKVKLVTAQSNNCYCNGGLGSVYKHRETQPRNTYA